MTTAAAGVEAGARPGLSRRMDGIDDCSLRVIKKLGDKTQAVAARAENVAMGPLSLNAVTSTAALPLPLPLPLPLWAGLTLAALVLAVCALVWLHWGAGFMSRQARSRRPVAHPVLLAREDFEQALQDAAFDCDQSADGLCVLLVNLDNLDAVNQGYGHQQADALIADATDRLLALCGPSTLMTRLGGVDFVVLARMDEAAACTLAARLCLGLTRPLFPVPDRADASMSCSVGLAVYPRHGARQRLVDHASTAMRQVKRAGGSDYMVFDPKTAFDHREHAELVADLRQAVAHGELELYYQPKVDARSLQFTAAEALLRWHHPRRGMISPSVFIPMAERYGLIGVIGNWVIDDAARQAAVWRSVGLRMRVAINISAYQMRQDDLVDRIDAALSRHRLQPGRFTCEITESVAMEDTRVTQRSFERMRQAGLHVSIDDFGVGQASLSYLRRLPAAELKIDASFVQDLDSSADARAIVEAVVSLAHALNLKVVAEGVETEKQRDLLVKMACDEMQGFLFARPMTAKALTALASLDPDHPPAEVHGFRASLFHETAPQSI